MSQTQLSNRTVTTRDFKKLNKKMYARSSIKISIQFYHIVVLNLGKLFGISELHFPITYRKKTEPFLMALTVRIRNNVYKVPGT